MGGRNPQSALIPYNTTFLPHTSLYYNATTDTQYADDNDCLMIRVIKVDIHSNC